MVYVQIFNAALGTAMYSATSSLTDPSMENPIADGILWIQGTALGTTATIVAVVAVAAIGLLMLSGRLELRRGISVVVGCFILFGAASFAQALSGATNVRTSLQYRAIAPSIDPPPQMAPTPSRNAYDPYAGASVPTGRR